MSGNGYKRITAIGVVIGILIGLGGGVLAFGMDLGQLRINTSAIAMNTTAIRDLERCYATQVTQLEFLREQNTRISNKLDKIIEMQFKD